MAPDVAFRVSVHPAHHNKTSDFKEAERQPWSAVDATIEQLLHHVSSGKAFLCGVTTNGGRKATDIECAQLICLDIDGDIPIDDFWCYPIVKQHCLATYTSVSHRTGKRLAEGKPCDDSFRAIFNIGKPIDDRNHYKHIFAQIADRLPFTLSDWAGQTPERLFYGNDQSEVQQNPEAQPLPWNWIETAQDAALAEVERHERQRSAALNLEFTNNDISRADWLLRSKLPGSQHGAGRLGYEKYWFPVFCAVAKNIHHLEDAFLVWHNQGQHTGERVTLKRFEAIRDVELPALFVIADDICPEWREECPYKNDFTAVGKTLGSAMTLDSTALEETRSYNSNVPDSISKAALAKHRATALKEKESEAQPETKEPDHFDQLFRLRAYREFWAEGLWLPCDDRDFRTIEDNILKHLYESQLYNRSAERLDLSLLERLAYELGIRPKRNIQYKLTKITPSDRARSIPFLVPNWLLQRTDHILYGQPGCGKTQLAIHLVRAALGDPTLNSFADSGTFCNSDNWDKTQALFIQTDMLSIGHDNTCNMLESLSLMSNEPLLNRIDWWFEDFEQGIAPFELSLRGLVELDRKLKEARDNGRPYSIVVIDSLKAVCPDDVKVGDQRILQYFRCCNRIVYKHNAALLWIHHSHDNGKTQGISRIGEETSALIHLEYDKDKRLIKTEIRKLRGQGKSRQLLLDFMSKPEVRVVESTGTDDEPQESLSDFLFRKLIEDWNGYRAKAPDVSPRTLLANYPGIQRGTFTRLVRESSDQKASDTTIKTTLASLVSAGRIERRGNASAATYVPTLGEASPATEEFDF